MENKIVRFVDDHLDDMHFGITDVVFEIDGHNFVARQIEAWWDEDEAGVSHGWRFPVEDFDADPEEDAWICDIEVDDEGVRLFQL